MFYSSDFEEWNFSFLDWERESMKIFYYILLSVKRERDFSFYASNVTFCWKFRQERKENDLSVEYLESVALLEIWWFIQFCKTVLDANQDLSQWLFRWISKVRKKCDYQNFLIEIWWCTVRKYMCNVKDFCQC